MSRKNSLCGCFWKARSLWTVSSVAILSVGRGPRCASGRAKLSVHRRILVGDSRIRAQMVAGVLEPQPKTFKWVLCSWHLHSKPACSVRMDSMQGEHGTLKALLVSLLYFLVFPRIASLSNLLIFP
jgi:hypothetical protein